MKVRRAHLSREIAGAAEVLVALESIIAAVKGQGGQDSKFARALTLRK
jgi:hypothetical protein